MSAAKEKWRSPYCGDRSLSQFVTSCFMKRERRGLSEGETIAYGGTPLLAAQALVDMIVGNLPSKWTGVYWVCRPEFRKNENDGVWHGYAKYSWSNLP